MPEIVVAAESRTETGKNVNRRLRTRGLIPGVLYGAKKEAVPVAVSPKEITSILRSKTGENTLFDLEIGGSRRKVILKEFQVEPIKGSLLHADFYEVALDKTIEVKVHVEVVGRARRASRSRAACSTSSPARWRSSASPPTSRRRSPWTSPNLEMNQSIRVADLHVPGRRSRC